MKNRYSEYKPSEVEWIGEIPSHWVKSRIGYVSKLITGFPWKSDLFNFEEGLKIVRGENVSEGFFRWGERTRRWKFEVEESSIFFLKSGDIVISMDGSKVGKNYVLVKQEDLPLLLHQRMCRVRVGDKLIDKFLSYYIGSEMFRYYIDITKTDPMIPHITQKDIFDFCFPIPPLPEQEEIVKYLDEKTGEIDNLISITEKKIELLKENRTSTINRVITKGLNPDVELKNIGIEWIGEIPKHWKVVKLKYLVEVNKNTLPENTNPEYELNYVEISDVDSLGNIKNSTPYLFKESPSRCRRILNKNDVFISTVRTYLKSIGYVKDEVNDLICSTGFCVLSPLSEIIPVYLFYMVLCEWFIGEVISKSVGVSYPSITSTELENISVILPNLKEQEEMVSFIDQQTKEIDNLISIEQSRIDTLREYRQSLISEVITGKVRVYEEVLEPIRP